MTRLQTGIASAALWRMETSIRTDWALQYASPTRSRSEKPVLGLEIDVPTGKPCTRPGSREKSRSHRGGAKDANLGP